MGLGDTDQEVALENASFTWSSPDDGEAPFHVPTVLLIRFFPAGPERMPVIYVN